jgi:hypothetical protein
MEYAYESAIRIGHHNASSRTGRRLGQRLRNEHCTGPGVVQIGYVAAGDGERERIRPGAVQGTYDAEPNPPIAKQAATDQVGDRLRGKAPGRHVTSCPLSAAG